VTRPTLDPLRKRSHRGPLVVGVTVALLGSLVAVLLLRPDPAPVAASGEPAVLLAAGDIGDCETPGDEATAELLADFPNATIVTLGDNAYPQGRAEDFARCFEPTWGEFKARIRPSPGNHDYSTDGAEAYFAYFGGAAGDPEQGWYSFDVGAWHVISLNSECRRVGGCEPDESQARWLTRDLETNAEGCVLAYWHRPPFTSGRYGDNQRDKRRMQVLWRILYEHRADVVLTGHEHGYERFDPLDAQGREREDGMRLFVVGTGGGNLRDYDDPPLPATAVRDGATWGVLKLTLHATRYAWEFLPAADGSFRDAGEGTCR